MEDDLSESSSRTVCLQTSIELSGAPFITCRLRTVPPSHKSPINPCKESASYSASHISPIEKASTKFSFHDGYRATLCSRTPSIGKMLAEFSLKNRSQIYRQTIHSILEADRSVALEMLRWVTYATRPLYTWELLDAIDSQTEISIEESDIERICGGLLSISEDSRVFLVHLSLQDYLHSQSKDDDILGWSTVSCAPHEMIACTCLRFLGSEDLLDCPTLLPFANRCDIINDERHHTFRAYARKYWRFHYNHAEHKSCYLPGMLHGKLQRSWRKGSGTLESNYTREQNSPSTECQESSNSRAGVFLNAVLREGARSGMVKLVKLELEMGASPNASDSFGMTPLHYAAAGGHSGVIKLLVDYGGNSNIESESGETALFHALANRHVEAAKLLLARGLISGDNNSGTHQNQLEYFSAPAFHQKLSLAVLLSSSCSACGDIQSHYVISKLSNVAEDYEVWPPIHVMDQPAPTAKCVHSAMQENSQFPYGTVFSEQRTMVKWFPGINMYRALGVAAESGMDEVLKLLIVAGNDVEVFERNTSLSKLMSKMRIS